MYPRQLYCTYCEALLRISKWSVDVLQEKSWRPGPDERKHEQRPLPLALLQRTIPSGLIIIGQKFIPLQNIDLKQTHLSFARTIFNLTKSQMSQGSLFDHSSLQAYLLQNLHVVNLTGRCIAPPKAMKNRCLNTWSQYRNRCLHHT